MRFFTVGLGCRALVFWAVWCGVVPCVVLDNQSHGFVDCWDRAIQGGDVGDAAHCATFHVGFGAYLLANGHHPLAWYALAVGAFMVAVKVALDRWCAPTPPSAPHTPLGSPISPPCTSHSSPMPGSSVTSPMPELSKPSRPPSRAK